MRLQASLDGLEDALRRAEHPLADPALRPAGVSIDELRELEINEFGGHLPAEAQVLWAWWGTVVFPRAVKAIRPTVMGLPGRVNIFSPRSAINQRSRIEATLGEAIDSRWVPFGFVAGAEILWFDLQACDDGIVPVTITDTADVHPKTPRPVWKFDSTRRMIDAMAAMLDEGIWWHHPFSGWQSHEFPTWHQLDETWDDRAKK